MKSRLLPLLIAALFALRLSAAESGHAVHIAPADAAKLVAEGKAVLVDVREPSEWAELGVAAPATLLPTSDFKHDRKQWAPFLKGVGDKTIITYCAVGIRAGRIADVLAAEGFKTAVAGGFKDWTAAGLPVRKVDAAKP